MSEREDIEHLVEEAMLREYGFVVGEDITRAAYRKQVAKDFAQRIIDRVHPYVLPTYTYVIQNMEANAGYDTEIVGSVQARSYEEAVTLAAARGFNVSRFRSPYTLMRL